jgi:hypothetical protein
MPKAFYGQFPYVSLTDMLTLGLYNTYDKIKVVEAHYRGIARAAPIAYAYGFNLALVGFPYEFTQAELVEFVRDNTTIGASGAYLQKLHEEKRLYVMDVPERGFPPQFGSLVVTTSRPEKKKAATSREVADMMGGKKSLFVLIGLGRKGLPKEYFEMARYQLDITDGKGISLETCTAIGAVAARLATLAECVERKG